MAIAGTDKAAVREEKWISQAFFKRRGGGAGNQASQFSSKQSLNFYDTTLGGNKSMNPPPQFTRFADPKEPSISPLSKGMGGYYTRAIFNNRQRVSLQAGIPAYNPISRFFANFYDYNLGALVRNGEVSTAYNAGYVLGTLFTLPFQAFFGANRLLDRVGTMLSGNPYSKFYYLDPKMPIYWNSVLLLFNKLAVETGALAGATTDNIRVADNSVEFHDQGSNNLGLLSSMLPDVLREASGGGHYIDVKSVSSRSQRMADAFNRKVNELANSVDSFDEFKVKLSELQDQKLNDGTFTKKPKNPDMLSYFKDYAATGVGGTAAPVPQVDAEGKPLPVGEQGENIRTGAFPDYDDATFSDYLNAELKEGSLFVTFDVDYTGPSSASFNNSTKAAPIKEAANAASSSARDIFVNFGGGNLTDNAIGNAVESVMSGVVNMFLGAADSVGLGGIGALAGAAYMEMPDIYDDSSAELPKNTYTMRLATPYGNKYSILTRVFMPLCCLMAMALPRRTGKNSYGAPFIVREHCQGFADTKLGIIDNLSIEIGTGNIGRSVDGLPTAIDVTFSVQNLDSIMSVPVADSLTSEVFNFSPFDEDTAVGDFLTCLAGTSLADQFYMANRVRRAWDLQQMNFEQFTSPSFFAQWAGSTGLGSLVSAFQKVGDI